MSGGYIGSCGSCQRGMWVNVASHLAGTMTEVMEDGRLKLMADG